MLGWQAAFGGLHGLWWAACARVREKKKASGLVAFAGLGKEKGEMGRVRREGQLGQRGKRKRGVRGLGFSLFFSNLFKLLNLNSFQNLNTSSLFQNFQNNLKTCKTSYKQTINTMQLKDDAQALIGSKIIKMLFKYFKGQIYLIIYLILRK
jgi:hypothetical protein